MAFAERSVPRSAPLRRCLLRLLVLTAAAALVACGGAADRGDGDTAEADGVTAEAKPPEILILGTAHLAQMEERVPDDQIRAVVDSLGPYAPDMIVVEFLPPDWPYGKGRDYRTEFDLASFAEDWGVPMDSVPSRLERLEAGIHAPGDLDEATTCRLARLHFLRRDFASALYHWLDADCVDQRDPVIAERIDARSEHEMARIAFPLGRPRGLTRIVSFDYQGDDARWFFGDSLYAEIRENGTAVERAELDSVMSELGRLRAEMTERQPGSFLEDVRFRNSQEWIDTQRYVYEDVFPGVTYDSAGARQTANYWRRNRRMYEEIEEAVQRERPERILVVVGAGHKYFLDELAEAKGWRWVDPLEYLGAPSRAESGADSPDRPAG